MKLKKSVKRTLIVLVLLILIISIIIIYLKCFRTTSVKKAKVIEQINEYGYQLKDSKNKAYIEEFKNLKDILSKDDVNEEKYAESISKLFIIDFYSLDDKLAKTDVGGVEFVHSKEQEDFLEKAENTLYKYLESNVYGGRKQSLPSVEQVNINNIEKTSFTFLDTVDDEAFKVSASWDYKDSSGEDYQKEATLILVHEGKKLSLVELE